MRIIKFFDRLEDRIREKLSRKPILYAFLGGFGVVLFWRGVWLIADESNISSFFSLILGSLILLFTGAFVSTFIGNKLIISGLYKEKKLTEKTKNEIKTEEFQIEQLQKTIDRVEKKIDGLEVEIKENNDTK